LQRLGNHLRAVVHAQHLWQTALSSEHLREHLDQALRR
jgi:hypothetical protein